MRRRAQAAVLVELFVVVIAAVHFYRRRSFDRSFVRRGCFLDRHVDIFLFGPKSTNCFFSPFSDGFLRSSRGVCLFRVEPQTAATAAVAEIHQGLVGGGAYFSVAAG